MSTAYWRDLPSICNAVVLSEIDQLSLDIYLSYAISFATLVLPGDEPHVAEPWTRETPDCPVALFVRGVAHKAKRRPILTALEV